MEEQRHLDIWPRRQRKAIAVDTLRDAMIANFEKEDLDVPAFLRKRTK